MNKRMLCTSFVLALLSLSPIALAQPYNVTVRFWEDTEMNNPYVNDFMKVYFQNQSYIGGWDYQYKCYHGDYINGTAVITVNETNSFDLLITDGNLQWSNLTGCPVLVENYDFWATVQSNMLIDHTQTLNYWINITIEGQPRQYFWQTQSIRSMISAGYWLVAFAVIIFVEWWIVKQGSNPSVILPIVMLIIFAIVKLAIGL